MLTEEQLNAWMLRLEGAELTAFFHGLEIVEPGVSLSADWRPELGEVIDVPGHEPIPGYAGVARKR